MNVIYSDMPHEGWAEHSIFLIGPTPRERSVASWRPEALQILDGLGYAGTVLVPEWSSDLTLPFAQQVAWEYYGTEHASVLAAWVPREMKDMPALTTNVEFGLYVKSGRLVYGRPDSAPHCGYLDYVYERETGCKPFNNLEDLLAHAIAR
jgi:hypothetical protein